MRRAVFIIVSILFLGAVAPAQNLQFKNPPELAKPNGHSHVVIVNHGKLAFISGQVGLNSKGEISSDFAAQTKQAFANLKLRWLPPAPRPRI
jgi:enamine deaminase RidA (YjgF/YER057c/UK114 family)